LLTFSLSFLILQLEREPEAPERQKKRHKFQRLSSLDRRVEEIVQNSYGIVRRSGAPAAHASPVSSILFSPKGMYLHSFSLSSRVSEVPQLKTWDAQVKCGGDVETSGAKHLTRCCELQLFSLTGFVAGLSASVDNGCGAIRLARNALAARHV
jgi:hypothetical protein